MRKLLACRIGKTDLAAAAGDPKVGGGPIATALNYRIFDEVLLLFNEFEQVAEEFKRWFGSAPPPSRITDLQHAWCGP